MFAWHSVINLDINRLDTDITDIHVILTAGVPRGFSMYLLASFA